MNRIRIINKLLGVLLEETFVDNLQFEIFLKSVDGALVLKNDFKFFNGNNFLIHIPFEILKESYVFAKSEPTNLIDKLISKNLIEK